MSRIRSIHPGLWTDEAFVSLSPFARLLFMGIWNECDDMGSFEWSPLKLKMRLLPADAVDAAALLEEMAQAGAVMRYEAGGKCYGAVRNFCQYQRPKKPNCTYPQTDEVREWVNTEARSTRDGSEPVPHQSPTSGEKPRQMKEEGGRSSSVPNGTASESDPDKAFWDSAKGYLGKSKGGLINKLAGQYGRAALAEAITTSMLASPQPPNREAYVIGILKRQNGKAVAGEVW